MLSDRRPEWTALAHHRDGMGRTLRDLTADQNRFRDFSLALPGLLLDYSRQPVTRETIGLLLDLARACGLEDWRDRMFAGGKINASENRAVLHTALRRPAGDSVMVDGIDIMPGIHETLARMKDFTEAVHRGRWTGHTGKPIETIVNIGIGGSDLGPRMVASALQPFHQPGLDVRFVSNVDGNDLYKTLRHCDAETTLFLIASKTFTTAETMLNARTARRWLAEELKTDQAVPRHFAALSTNAQAVQDFGIDPDSMFPFGEWVGGRYSVWSSIGLSVCLAIGFARFTEFLAGAHAMDRHFASAALAENAPVLLALTGLWNRNFENAAALAVLPYDDRLALFPAWMQQADMESNGKSVTRDGETLHYGTAPIVFGTPGTDCQHSFFQMVHQGPCAIPCDFIAALEPAHPYREHHVTLLANMIAQADALTQGRDLAESGNDPQRFFSGNRPSNVVLLDRLDPWHLGQLMALYEHKIFVQGILWNINSFDQFGVELGKVLANQTLAILTQDQSKPLSGLPGVIRQHLKH